MYYILITTNRKNVFCVVVMMKNRVEFPLKTTVIEKKNLQNTIEFYRSKKNKKRKTSEIEFPFQVFYTAFAHADLIAVFENEQITLLAILFDPLNLRDIYDM